MNRPENTAITRSTLSRPLKDAIKWGWLTPEHRVLDFGCGRGADVNWLREQGYRSDGFDRHAPFGFHATPRGEYDFVAVVYVVNVIDELAERGHIVQAAWSFVRSGGAMLVISRSDSEIEQLAGAKGWPAWKDGFWSNQRRGMFQKGHSTADLRELVAQLSPRQLRDTPTKAYSGLLATK